MTLRIIQISDTHLDHDVPQRMHDLENCIRAINQESRAPDLVVHTGDISHNGLIEEYHTAQQLLDQLNAPYLVMAGNRDKRSELLTVFADDRYQLPTQGWVQYAIEQHDVRLLLVDTVCKQSNKGQLCQNRLNHLESMLQADMSKPVALFLHHTPFEATGIPDPFQFEDWKDVRRLADLMSKYNTICGVYCGHVHRFLDGCIAGVNASAISCLAGDLRKGEVSESERKLPVYKLITLPS